ncbi:MAG: UDP-N-acetylglucosamine 2-epimerase (non-hydrolyzing) [Candidatus Zixiibacteriota bacterium]|nr:MAG: UDP-N-acetylglucosamine 2-epimerase (non-hydrolyzing) [candidate division Zixibacteria bacterium]
MKIMMVVGARPNYMKAAPIIKQMHRFADFLEPIIVHTGQHYDHILSEQIMSELGMPQPDIYLGVGSGTHAEQTANTMLEFERILIADPPHLVAVFEDVNSTLACALVAAKCKILIAHVEAGLRSFDMSAPEEINRVLTDRVSDFLFPSESAAFQNLMNEGFDAGSVFYVGNTMIDSLTDRFTEAQTRPYPENLDLKPKSYALLTLHKPENVDDFKIFRSIINAVGSFSDKMPVVFPAHPRTKLNIDKFELSPYLERAGIKLIGPTGYLDFLKLESEAAFVMTDSGGVQDETTFLNVPCLTLREITERPVTTIEGTNILVGRIPERIAAEAERILGGNIKEGSKPKYWDGEAGKRIAETFIKIRQNLFEPESIKDGTKKMKTVREIVTAGG